MKYFATIFFFASITFLANTQTPTKEETQDWIRGIVDTYPARVERMERSEKIKFSQSKLIITISSISAYLSYETVITVPIEKIISVKFNAFNESIYNLVIVTKGNDVSYFSKDEQTKDMKSKTSISFSKNIDEESLRPRLIKAFKFLVKEYGGEIKDDPF